MGSDFKSPHRNGRFRMYGGGSPYSGQRMDPFERADESMGLDEVDEGVVDDQQRVKVKKALYNRSKLRDKSTMSEIPEDLNNFLN